METSEVISELRKRTAIENILSSITTKSATGRGYICPICNGGTHKGNTLQISEKGQISCFKCKTGINEPCDIVEFYKRAKGVDFATALNDCCELAGVQKASLANTIKGSSQKHQTEDKTAEVYGRYVKKLIEVKADTPAEEYAIKRGLLPNYCRRNGVIFADTKSEFIKYGFTVDKQAYNISGMVFNCRKGYTARLTEENGFCSHLKSKKGDSENDYLFIANENANKFVVTEAVLDSLTFLQTADFLGFKDFGAIALNGVTNQKSFLNYLNSGENTKNNIYLLAFDNDNAGINGNKELLKQMKSKGFNVLKINEKHFNGNKDFNEYLNKNGKAFFNEILHICEQINERFKNIEEPLNNFKLSENIEEIYSDFEENTKEYIQTPFIQLNDCLNGGLTAGKLYIFGGVTGIGKTAFISQMCEQFCKQKHPVLYYSLELSKMEISSRILSRYSAEISRKKGYGLNKLGMTQRNIENLKEFRKSAYCTEEHAETIEEAKNYLKNEIAPYLYICDNFENFNVNSINDNVKEIKKAESLAPVVVVDYLQLLPSVNKHQTEQRLIIKENVTFLKNLAVKLNAVVIAISSLARYADTNSLTAFKEAGEIEYTADCALMLVVDNVDTFTNTSAQTLKILKARGARCSEIAFTNHYIFNYYTED